MSPFAESAREISFDIALQPKQDDLWSLVDESPFTNLGYGGRRGGGKSGGMRRIFMGRRLKYNETNGILIRRTYQELYQNHLEPMFREYPQLKECWVEKHKYLDFPNGSKLYFGYAQHEIDVDKLFGSEFADIGVEEAGLFTQRELEKMKGSNRWTGNSEITPKMLSTFMPGGRSHFYLKRVFIDRQYEENEDGSSYAFLEAYGWDNVEWCRKMLVKDGLTDVDFYSWPEEARKAYFLKSDYAAKLLSITDENLRQAWIEGNWEKFEGIVFPELREDVHNLDKFVFPFTPNRHKLLSALDWAATGTTAATLAAVDEQENLYMFEEYAAKNKLVSEHCANILKMLKGPDQTYQNEYTLMDLPVHVLNQHEMASIQREFATAGLFTVQAHRAHIEMGINLLKEYLKVDPLRRHPFTGRMGSPRYFISKKGCPVAWKQIRELQRMIDLDTGKVKFVGEDDALDTHRYIAMSRASGPSAIPDFSPAAILAHGQKYTTVDAKAQRALARLDKTFGKDPNANEWFPR